MHFDSKRQKKKQPNQILPSNNIERKSLQTIANNNLLNARWAMIEMRRQFTQATYQKQNVNKFLYHIENCSLIQPILNVNINQEWQQFNAISSSSSKPFSKNRKNC